VKLGAGTLGAVLAAVGLHSVKHPIKATKTTAKVAGKASKYLLEHPYLAPLAIPAAGAAAYGLDVYKSRQELGAHAQGGLNMFGGGATSQRQIEESFLGGGVTRGFAHTRAGGRAAGGGETPGEAALVARAIERLTPTHDQHAYVLNMDGVKVAEGLLHNPRARRVLAEAAAIYAQGMAARK
jgi:hypothetical protein